jgi:MOSC domain-containing protein YiiM
VRRILPDLSPGAFAENIVTEGIDWTKAVVGDRCRLGNEVLLEITQIGKECHTACAIGEATGNCIMPRDGIFCRVLVGGHLRPGDAVDLLPRTSSQ